MSLVHFLAVLLALAVPGVLLVALDRRARGT